MNEHPFTVKALDRADHGGQHVGVRPTGMIVTHTETGVTVTIPPESAARSQHQTRYAALAGLEMTLLELGYSL